MRCSIVKVSASDCPNGIGRPESSAEWEGKNFKTGRPQQSSTIKDVSEEDKQDPEAGDHLLIWVNGSGLTAMAEVGDFHDNDTLVSKVELHPKPLLNDEDLEISEIAALRDLKRSRRMKLRAVSNEDFSAIRHAAQLKLAKEHRRKLHISGDEGKRRLVKSERLERDSKLARLAKEKNQHEHDGVYECEACNFRKSEVALFDAHHLSPLSLGERETKVGDFAVLCPTCHRVAHHRGPTRYCPLTPLEIKKWWSEHKSTDMGDPAEVTGRTE